ncbi:hypothetical protein TNCV_3472501 [Trichonephila clavipes]|nr:hypothetical protein TNCV_3472501 [Trichonephila clavipes]
MRAAVQRSREKEKKQQNINRTQHILLKGSTTIGVQNYDQKSSGSLTAQLHGIPYVLEDSWYVFSLPSTARRNLPECKEFHAATLVRSGRYFLQQFRKKREICILAGFFNPTTALQILAFVWPLPSSGASSL